MDALAHRPRVEDTEEERPVAAADDHVERHWEADVALQVRREPYTLRREAKGDEQKRHAHHVRVKRAANRHLVVVRALKKVGVIVAREAAPHI